MLEFHNYKMKKDFSQPRVRMFAGPNGSGKSRLKKEILLHLDSALLGIYINPDEIEKAIEASKRFYFDDFEVETSQEEVLSYFEKSRLGQEQNLDIKKIIFTDDYLDFSDLKINSYFASILSDFLRNKLLEMGRDFSFETVMSHESKIDFLKKANKSGYKTYLYYICTKDPDINVDRVRHRFIKEGGHNVSEDKIRSIYSASLSLLKEAADNSWRTYFFDNSGSGADSTYIAQSKNGIISGADEERLVKNENQTFEWFDDYFWNKAIIKN